MLSTQYMGKFCVSSEVLRGMMHQFLIGRYGNDNLHALFFNITLIVQQYIHSTVSL